jgi:hypothetical protein
LDGKGKERIMIKGKNINCERRRGKRPPSFMELGGSKAFSVSLSFLSLA